MTREEAIEVIDNRFDIMDYCESARLEEALDLAIESLKQPQPHWIPCSERLPEEDHWLGGSGRQFSDKVLISILNSADGDEWVNVAQSIDGEWALELPRDCKVIAWQPLPSPYQPEEESE